MSENKKFYWLKLKRDFFKRHDIRIIEEMENGKDYILFYLKLLLESVNHEGHLRFSETIPYNEKMLSVVTNTNIDIVRSAMKIFIDLEMIEILDDSTIYMTEVIKLVGSETAIAERVRKHRSKQKLLQCNINALQSNTELELEKELELELEKEETTTQHARPTNLEVAEYFGQYLDEENAGIEAWRWYQYNEQRGWDCLPDWKTAAQRWIENM
jgi:predicted phage replisome organizer